MNIFKDNKMKHLKGCYSSLDFVNKCVESKQKLLTTTVLNLAQYELVQAGWLYPLVSTECTIKPPYILKGFKYWYLTLTKPIVIFDMGF